MLEVVVEVGSRKTFASALDWPGWSRSGRDEEAAVEALLAYGKRYRRAIASARAGFDAPRDAAALRTRRVKGNASTDFGVPDAITDADRVSPDAREAARLTRILRACWRTFDETAAGARGIELRKGPRGGGRDLEKIRHHVYEGEWSYLKQLGGTPPKAAADLQRALDELHDAFIDAFEARLAGELPSKGPRGRVFWPPRYAIRRAAWHVLDHAWEIEDRALPEA